MKIAYTLLMPHCGSWNGKWSGAGKPYVVIRNYKKSKCPEIKYQEYNFGDGWVAQILMEQVDYKRAKQLEKISQGFRMYDWMIALS